MAVITVSREPGALGEEVAARLAGLLGFFLIDKVRISQLWKEMELDEARLIGTDDDKHNEGSASDSNVRDTIVLVSDMIAHLAEEQDLVVIGRGGQALFRHCPGTLHVRIVASRPFRTRQLQRQEKLTAREARRRLRELESQRALYMRRFFGLNWADPSLYDLILRMDRFSLEQVLNVTVAAVETMQLTKVPRREVVQSLLPETPKRHGSDHFANSAEVEFAHFLEFYRIPYQYEPRTFPLEMDAAGKVVEAFTPDFYLPEQDLYIELTTMKQSLVTRKNRKVRKLRKLYPDVNIRIFYQRDFYSLLAKYGLLVDRDGGTRHGVEPDHTDTAPRT